MHRLGRVVCEEEVVVECESCVLLVVLLCIGDGVSATTDSSDGSVDMDEERGS